MGSRLNGHVCFFRPIPLVTVNRVNQEQKCQSNTGPTQAGGFLRETKTLEGMTGELVQRENESVWLSVLPRTSRRDGARGASADE